VNEGEKGREGVTKNGDFFEGMSPVMKESKINRRIQKEEGKDGKKISPR